MFNRTISAAMPPDASQTGGPQARADDRRGDNPAKPRISRWRAEFVDREVEQRFRIQTAQDWRRTNIGGLLVFSLLVLVSGALELLKVGWVWPVDANTFMRAGMMAVVAATVVCLLRCRNPRNGDWAMLATVLTAAAFFAAITAQRPVDPLQQEPITYHLVGVCFIFACYMYFHSRFWMSTVCGIAATVGNQAGMMLNDQIPHPAVELVAPMWVIGNMLMAYMSFRLHLLRRLHFGAYISEKTAREDLLRKELDLIAASQSLKQARDKALKDTKAKSDFMAHISHEVRTPLNAIIGFTDTMRARALGQADFGPYSSYLDDISDSSRHLLSVINDLLDLSKVEAGKFEIADDEFAVDELFTSSLRMVADRAERENIRLIVGDVVAGLHVRGDQRVLRQVLVNLLTNAIKYAKTGGWARIDTLVTDKGELNIAVSDNGPGIPDEEIPRVMELYGRADRARRLQVDGSGLGLPVARMHMELHGGSLTLSSGENAGTTVTIVLPAHRVMRKAAAATSQPAQKRRKRKQRAQVV